MALRGGVIRKRIVAVKALASAISIGSGGSVGREGPIVQIASALGSAIGQLLKVPASQLRVIVACGAAAGVSATFNAPIAGALFAAEVVVGNFALAQLSPIVISSVVATVISRFFLGNHPAFEVPGYELVSPFELIPYMLVGVAAGLVALVFMRTLYATEDLFDRIPIPDYTKAALGGLMVGAIGIALPNVFGVGYSTITAALHDQLPLALLGMLLVAKIAATVDHYRQRWIRGHLCAVTVPRCDDRRISGDDPPPIVPGSNCYVGRLRVGDDGSSGCSRNARADHRDHHDLRTHPDDQHHPTADGGLCGEYIGDYISWSANQSIQRNWCVGASTFMQKKGTTS